MKYAYIDAKSSQVLGWLDTEAYNYAELPASEQLIQLTDQEFAQLQGQNCIVVGGTVRVNDQPSPAHVWDTKKSAWVLDKTKQAELDKQAALAAGQARLHEIEQAIQSHINQTVAGIGMGFTDDQSLIGKYAGYDNVFRPIAEAVGKWVAEIWYLAAQDKVAIIAGEKAIPTADEALAQIPPFVMPEQQKVGE